MSLRRHLIVFAAFFALTGLALYPLLFHATTHVGGPWTTDYYHFHWNFWWVRHALATPGLDVFQTNFVLFPATTSLAYHTLTLAWYPLWALLEPLTGTLVAMLIIMLLAMALSGYCAFLLLRAEHVPPVLALSGGAIYMLTPAMLLAVMLSTINYISLFWYPLILLLWGRLARASRPFIWALLLGAALYGMMLTDYQHAIFLAVLIVPCGLLTLIQARDWTARLRLIAAGLLALALMTALLWFVGPLRPLLAFDRSTLSPMSIDKAQSITFPEGFLGRFGAYDHRHITLGGLVLPALLLTLIAGPLLRRRVHDRRRWFWLALVIAPLLLLPGAAITLGGQSIAMPYVWLHDLFGGLFRSPARFAPPLILAALVFIGRTWGPHLARRRAATPLIGAVIMLLVVVEARLFEPMPIQPAVPAYDFYARIGQETGEPYDHMVIVEIPNAGGSGEAWVGAGDIGQPDFDEFRPMQAQFYGMTHGKRMLNGSIARAPLDHFWYWLTDDPMLAWFGQRRYLEPEKVEAQLRQRIFDWPIGYIVVHQDWIGRVGPTVQEIIGYLNGLPDLLCPVWVERDAVVYRTAWHPDGCPSRTPPETEPGVYTIDIGSEGDERFIGWGWHWPEQVAGLTLRWSGEYPRTRLYLDLPPAEYELSLSTQSFWEPRHLTIRVNEVTLGEAGVAVEGLQTLTFSLPAEAVGEGRNLTLTLDYDAVIVPADVGQSADPRRLALAVDWIRFRRVTQP